MNNYIIYKDEYGNCIVEVLNQSEHEMLSVQQTLTQKGYIISEVCGTFIKCRKINEGEEIL